MDLRQMTQKSVREGIKKGMTMADFCEKYNCSQEELEGRVGVLYKRSKKSAKSCLDQILANEKKARKVKANKPAKEADRKPTEACSAKPKAATEAPEEKLRRLQMDEKKLSDAVMKLESDHKILTGKHRDCLKALRDKKAEIDQLKADFVQKCADYEALVGQNNALVKEMNAISDRRHEQKIILDDVRREIEELNKAILCVFNNGDITMFDGSKVTLSDEGYEKIYESLCANDLCDELRQRDVKSLARLLAIAENTTLTVEVVCESEELETAFGLLKKK